MNDVHTVADRTAPTQNRQHTLPWGKPLRQSSNMAHVRQSRPDSGRGFQLKDLQIFSVVRYSLGRGPPHAETASPNRTVPMQNRQHTQPWGQPLRQSSNMAHGRQSRPDSGRGFQLKDLQIFSFVRYSLGRGPPHAETASPNRTVPTQNRQHTQPWGQPLRQSSNMAHGRQSGPDSGLGFQVKVPVAL